MITSFYAGLLGLLFLTLTYNVIMRRMKLRVGIGAGNDPVLQRAIRVHGNFAELVPMALILMYFAEQWETPFWALHAMGAVLLLARILHAWGLSGSEGQSKGRFWGSIGTHAVLFAGALLCIYRFIMLAATNT